MAIAKVTPVLKVKLKKQIETEMKELAEVKFKELVAQKILESENQLLTFKIENQKQNLLNLMKNTNLTLEKAMNALVIP